MGFGMGVVEQFSSVRERVDFLLKSYPSLRDDDKKLWISYLVLYHGLQDVLSRPQPFDALCQMLLIGGVTSTESIRRIRQKIQEEGAYKRNVQPTHQKSAFNVRSRVEHLLKNYIALRDNDMQLWLAYLTMFHGLKERINESNNAYEDFCDILLDKEVPTMESIRRSRQIFQENGLYVGSKRQERLLAAKKATEWVKGV